MLLPRFTAFLFIASCLLSCSDGRTIYEKHEKLSPDLEWLRSDVKTFTIDIQENARPVEFAIAFRCASGYAYDKMLVRMTEVAPNGEKLSSDIDIEVRKQNGDFYGDKGFDIIDITQVIDAKKQYPAFGKYTYTIEHRMPEDKVDFAMEIGLIVRDTEKR